MTLNEITTLIASELQRALDEPLKLMIAERVGVWRSRLIKNSIDKDERERKYFKQTLFVPMVARNEVICSVPFEQCTIAVSKCELPKPLRANSVYYDYIGNITGTKGFKQVVAGTVSIMMSGKFSKNMTLYRIENGLLYVYNRPDLPLVMVEGIFDDPQEASRFNCICGTSKNCDYWNEEYPVSNDILQLIIQSVMQIDFNRAPNTPTKQIPVTDSIVKS